MVHADAGWPSCITTAWPVISRASVRPGAAQNQMQYIILIQSLFEPDCYPLLPVVLSLVIFMWFHCFFSYAAWPAALASHQKKEHRRRRPLLPRDPDCIKCIARRRLKVIFESPKLPSPLALYACHACAHRCASKSTQCCQHPRWALPGPPRSDPRQPLQPPRRASSARLLLQPLPPHPPAP